MYNLLKEAQEKRTFAAVIYESPVLNSYECTICSCILIEHNKINTAILSMVKLPN